MHQDIYFYNLNLNLILKSVEIHILSKKLLFFNFLKKLVHKDFDTRPDNYDNLKESRYSCISLSQDKLKQISMKRLNENQFDNERKLMNTFSNSNGIHLDNFF